MILKCPVCKIPFKEKLELKSKPDIYLCKVHGLFSMENNKLYPTKYPCPKCQSSYHTPVRHENGYAICECPIHGEYRINVQLSFNFRRLCSIVASKPNRSPSYYTPPEKEVKAILEKIGLKENIDFYHNKPFKDTDNKTIYYPDFVVERPVKAIIGVDPRIWHSRWNRESSDYRKKLFFKRLGYMYISLSDKDRERWYDIIAKILDEEK
jgi:hypothetical protein